MSERDLIAGLGDDPLVGRIPPAGHIDQVGSVAARTFPNAGVCITSSPSGTQSVALSLDPPRELV
ncbi:MAG: hypothetical protein ACR2M5_17010 [Nakamurella sp.]